MSQTTFFCVCVRKNSNSFFSFYSQRNVAPAPVAPAGPLNPPNGSYNPTINDIDRRRANLRARSDDELGGGQQSGPKNRYGDIWSE